MQRRARSLVEIVLVAVVAAAWHPAVPVPTALEPATTGGIETVDRSLAKLSTHRRVMVVGAHPDDEDNTVLALVSRGLGGEAAYLSLSRGEGGQNLVGPELGIGLGLIRTGELLAARRIEGSRQFFTRAFDFGYTRSLEETFERWPREIIQEDAVRAVRRFKPQVIVAVFPGDSRAGHGQHQMAGVIAVDMFDLAGEPDRFPGLTAEGLPPWQPEALYRRLWWGQEEPTFELLLGQVDPLSGRSMLQIAAASRSMHRSQDMGRLQPLGSRSGNVGWVAGEGKQDSKGLFDGIDTRLAALAGVLPHDELRHEIEAELQQVEELARAARMSLTPAALDRAVAPLAEIVASLQRVQAALAKADGQAAQIVRDFIDEKARVAGAGLAAAAGVAIEAVADAEAVAVGSSLGVSVEVWNSGGGKVRVGSAALQSTDGWRSSLDEAPDGALDPGTLQSWAFTVEVPAEVSPTVPYFLRSPLRGDLYDWSEVPAELRGEPYQKPELMALVDLQISGVEIRLQREVVYRYVDQAVGEIRRPLRATPHLEVSVEPSLLLWPLGKHDSRDLQVVLSSGVDRPLEGSVELRLADGERPLPPQAFSIEEPRGRKILTLPLALEVGLQPGAYAATVSAELADGPRFQGSLPIVNYPHVRPVAAPRPATVTIRALDLELPRLRRVGYIRGASDRVPEMLLAVGVPLKVLAAEDLSDGNLAQYDVIVVGSRAYETDTTLVRANLRLLEYARSGGTLIVQYQQYQFVRGAYAPYPLEIVRPHGRVTDEGSPVRILVPDHPVFQTPNRITEADWQDWVQERGLYFPSSWDEAYTPLLALRDPGREEELGSLLVAPVGEGTYIYTGLSFFRELPAGVPGALRLFINLLALGAS